VSIAIRQLPLMRSLGWVARPPAMWHNAEGH